MARLIAFSSEVGTGSRSNQVYADCVYLSAAENASKRNAQLPSSGSRMNDFFLPLGASGGVSTPKPGLKTPGWAARSASESVAVACDDPFAAFGGRSSGPLRPQPASASPVTLNTMMAHPDEVRR